MPSVPMFNTSTRMTEAEMLGQLNYVQCYAILPGTVLRCQKGQQVPTRGRFAYIAGADGLVWFCAKHLSDERREWMRRQPMRSAMNRLIFLISQGSSRCRG